MSHKKCPISKVFLRLIHWIPLLFFCMVHKFCLCTKFQTLTSKVSHLNFSLNIHFFVINISSVNPYFLVHHFHCCLTGNAFSAHLITGCVTSLWFFLMYTFSFLNHIFLKSLFLLASVQSLSHRQCLLPYPTHHHKRHLSTADTPTTQQNTTSHGQSTSPSYCHPAAPLLPVTSLTSHSLLAACRPTLVLAVAAWHLVSHAALISAPPTVQTK
jgi:hypothetical protein